MSHSAAYPCRHQLANSSAARETLVLSAIVTRAGLGLEKNRVLVCVCWGVVVWQASTRPPSRPGCSRGQAGRQVCVLLGTRPARCLPDFARFQKSAGATRQEGRCEWVAAQRGRCRPISYLGGNMASLGDSVLFKQENFREPYRSDPAFSAGHSCP